MNVSLYLFTRPCTFLIPCALSFLFPGCCCLPKQLQTPPGSLAPQDTSASCFGVLLQTAYESEGALLDERVQAQLRAALPRLPLHRVLRSVKHVLLYLGSTVENFGQVSAAPRSAAQNTAFSEAGPEPLTALRGVLGSCSTPHLGEQ